MAIWSLFRHKSKKKSKSQQTQKNLPKPPAHQILQENKDEKIKHPLEETITYIRSILGENDDFVMRQFSVFNEYPAVVMYFPDLVKKSDINEHILKPLINKPYQQSNENDSLKDVLMNDLLYACEGRTENRIIEIIQSVLEGNTVLMVEGVEEAFIFCTRHVEKRSITQPETEQVIRGARE
jgi:spore germination protein KA